MVKTPSPATLKKYGLTAQEWWQILDGQGGVCFVCQKVPTTGRMVTDHEHQKGWKKMPPDNRKLAVRGILCWWCNKTYLGRAITLEKARRVVLYLEQYEEQKSRTRS